MQTPPNVTSVKAVVNSLEPSEDHWGFLAKLEITKVISYQGIQGCQDSEVLSCFVSPIIAPKLKVGEPLEGDITLRNTSKGFLLYSLTKVA